MDAGGTLDTHYDDFPPLNPPSPLKLKKIDFVHISKMYGIVYVVKLKSCVLLEKCRFLGENEKMGLG